MRSAAGSPSRPPLRARDAVRTAGLAPLDAELLLARVLGTDRAGLHLHDEPLTPAQRDAFAALASRRRAGEPVAYLTGRRAFRHLELRVDARVLVPRPETEHLVEAALALPPGARVVDVGTGSGAVALALKHERPDLDVLGADVSPAALAVARANGRRLGLDVAWHEADLLDGVLGPLDAVVANLPYVAEEDPIGREVAFEPGLALWAGADGLDAIRRLVAGAAARTPFLALEVGAGQAGAVAELSREAGYRELRVDRDLAGIERVVVGRR